MFFFFKPKTAYELRISDWSSDVCSSDIDAGIQLQVAAGGGVHRDRAVARFDRDRGQVRQALLLGFLDVAEQGARGGDRQRPLVDAERGQVRTEARTAEIQSVMRSSYGVVCLKKTHIVVL